MNKQQGLDPREFAPVRVVKRQGGDGVFYLESGYEPQPAERCVGDWILHWAEHRPDTVFLAERSPDGPWRKVTYAQALLRILDLAGWLLETGADAGRPVAVLSESAVDHALLAFAAMHVGVPVATISTAYSLLSSDHAKLKAMIALLDPGVIYASDLARYGPALDAIAGLHRAEILVSRGDPASTHDHTLFSDAARPDLSSPVASAFAAITPDTTARLLFTSGSTGTPKAVINTHRMLTSNQQALRILWPFLQDEPPVIVDWLPWSHTFGGNFTTNMALSNGGSIYIDAGKPAPGLVDLTIRNMKEVRPNLCFNVPRGYEILYQAMGEDSDLRRVVFGMKAIFSAGAALPGTIWEGLNRMAEAEAGQPVPVIASWGSTETAPMTTLCHFLAEATGNIGVPVPGVSLKLVPDGGKLEIRVRGPNVTPGYYKQPERTREAFDDEGYYRMGDAVRLADPDDPAKGLYFDGRVSEDFKLSTGTWVSVGALRVAGIDALTPLVQDIVVTGHDRENAGFLLFPNEAACRKEAGLAHDAPLAKVLAHPAVTGHIARGLASLRATGAGSSRYAARARFLPTPPDPDSGEITDKAYLNQRQCLVGRAADIAALFDTGDPANILPA